MKNSLAKQGKRTFLWRLIFVFVVVFLNPSGLLFSNTIIDDKGKYIVVTVEGETEEKALQEAYARIAEYFAEAITVQATESLKRYVNQDELFVELSREITVKTSVIIFPEENPECSLVDNGYRCKLTVSKEKIKEYRSLWSFLRAIRETRKSNFWEAVILVDILKMELGKSEVESRIMELNNFLDRMEGVFNEAREILEDYNHLETFLNTFKNTLCDIENCLKKKRILEAWGEWTYLLKKYKEFQGRSEDPFKPLPSPSWVQSLQGDDSYFWSIVQLKEESYDKLKRLDEELRVNVRIEGAPDKNKSTLRLTVTHKGEKVEGSGSLYIGVSQNGILEFGGDITQIQGTDYYKVNISGGEARLSLEARKRKSTEIYFMLPENDYHIKVEFKGKEFRALKLSDLLVNNPPKIHFIFPREEFFDKNETPTQIELFASVGVPIQFAITDEDGDECNAILKVNGFGKPLSYTATNERDGGKEHRYEYYLKELSDDSKIVVIAKDDLETESQSIPIKIHKFPIYVQLGEKLKKERDLINMVEGKWSRYFTLEKIEGNNEYIDIRRRDGAKDFLIKIFGQDETIEINEPGKIDWDNFLKALFFKLVTGLWPDEAVRKEGGSLQLDMQPRVVFDGEEFDLTFEIEGISREKNDRIYIYEDNGAGVRDLFFDGIQEAGTYKVHAKYVIDENTGKVTSFRVNRFFVIQIRGRPKNGQEALKMSRVAEGWATFIIIKGG